MNYVKNLLPVLAHANLGGHVIGVRNADLNECLSLYPEALKIVGSSYEICLQLAIQKILFDLDRLSIASRIAGHNT